MIAHVNHGVSNGNYDPNMQIWSGANSCFPTLVARSLERSGRETVARKRVARKRVARKRAGYDTRTSHLVTQGSTILAHGRLAAEF